MMGREPAVRQQRGFKSHEGFVVKELKQSRYGVSVVIGGATRDVRDSEI